ncbi:MAG: transcriptional regulator, partial [Candidatus Thermoplasmatota archaeon]|nr:transcriptional regulator [Candidatus Thermoplasmatota archaeon]
MRYFSYPEKESITLAGILYALSDSVRLQIVMTLSDGAEKGAYEFKSLCKSPTLAYHFKILREAGITKT